MAETPCHTLTFWAVVATSGSLRTIVSVDASRKWIPEVGVAQKPSTETVFVSLTQAYNFYRHYSKLIGLILSLEPSVGAIPMISLSHTSVVGKVVRREIQNMISISRIMRLTNVARVNVSALTKGKKPFRKNTSCKTDCLAFMRVRKIEGDGYEVYWFVKENNHPLVSQQHFLMQESNSNVGPVRDFKLMKEIYGGFENVEATVADCKNFRRDMNVFIGHRDAQMAVGSSICKNSDFKRRLCEIVWNDQISPSIFEEEWTSIIADFDLSENKVRWIPAFLRDEDMYGLMRMTSRSESENHVFERFTTPHLTLVEFLSHFDSAMDSQWYVKRKNDHDTRYKTHEYRTELKLERDAAELYTLSVFFDVQDELFFSIAHCLSVNIEKIGLFEKYFIRDTEVKKWKDKNSFEVYESCGWHGFWEDSWITVCLLKDLYPCVYNLDQDPEFVVANRLDLALHALFLRRNPRGGAEEEQWVTLLSLLETHVSSNHRDRWIWTGDGDGLYLVKCGRNLIDKGTLWLDTYATRWLKELPAKVIIFIWRMLLNKFPTRMNLMSRGITVQSNQCGICDTGDETINHLMLHYDIARDVWALVGRWRSLDFPNVLSIRELLSLVDDSRIHTLAKKVLHVVVGTTFWSIWKFRNQCFPRGETEEGVTFFIRLFLHRFFGYLIEIASLGSTG
ncbi:zinc finger, SWIM-type, MULE transposase domain, FHY3/FAR1 family [Artemisia annua]|uniref:Zinc finger, SWIM-type, MULE transposase domain, FHY3/FAR1 family n=1 Tax=Artemisia annua TaxID=35608 RepID=A0A2U1MFE0_ARTAN|nr:zinc finger, SWIM-type, MULE transposase domain, FHY3/FAR1 family [Artemisia annua]